MSEKDKLLPDLGTGVKTKRIQKTSTDVPPVELPTEDDEMTDSETDTDGESDSDSDSDSEYECKVCDIKLSSYNSLKQHEKGKKHSKMILRKKKERKLKKDGLEHQEVEDEHLIPEPFATCEICDKQFSGPEAYQMHLQSKKHKQKVSVASLISQFREKGEINTEKLKEFYKNKDTIEDVPQNDEDKNASLVLKSEDKKSSEEFECKECDKVFSGLIPFTIHLTSKTHAKQLEKMNMLHKVFPETSDEIKESNLSSLSEEDGILVCKLCSMSFSGPENAMMHLKSKNHSKNLDRYVRKLKKKEKKEAKDLESSSERNERKVKPEDEDKTTKEEESIVNTSMKPIPDALDKLAGEDETEKNANDHNVKEELDAYEKYKKYKELMNSLQGDDEILK